MKKRVFALLLTVCMLLGLLPGWVERDQADPLPAGPEKTGFSVEELGYERDSLAAVTFTPFTGCFFTDMWGNGTSDDDVKKLLHGYPLTEFDVASQNFAINDDVVSGMQITNDRNGNREYNIFLNEDLYYSNGAKITAYDYAFSILFQLSPETAKTGANLPDLDYIIGASDFAGSRSKILSGVRVLSDYQLKITVNRNAFPYFYELSYIAFKPYPISVIAPGCEVIETGKGVSLEGRFSADILKRTVLDSADGYLSHPQVVSGPYTLTSFDGTTASFALNTRHKGSENASFETLTYSIVGMDEADDLLSSGKTAVVHKAMNSDTIVEMTQLLGDGRYVMSAYPRSGLSFVSFCCEQKAVGERKVRQAIAMCLDKEALTSAMVGNYGTVVNGYYGVGQWMYQIVSGAEPYPTEDGVQLDKWQKLNFDDVKTYEFDPEAAGKLLQNAGWKKNSDGIRQKQFGGKNVKLELTLVIAEESHAIDFMKNEFAAALLEAGVKLTVQVMPWEDMLRLYYREDKRDCDMFFLASNFEDDFNPSSWFSTAASAQGVANKTGIMNEGLYTYARNLVKTDPNDTLGYCTKWVKFLESMSDQMPVIPVYSNIYFDYYTAALQGYEPSMYLSWADSVYELSFKDIEG